MSPELRTEFSRFTPDELRELYKKNPEQFDELAADAINQACIGRTPEKTIKRRQMQWLIDAQLRKAKTPLGRMHMMENIFYSRVFGEDGELAHLTDNCIKLIRVATGTEKVPTKNSLLSLVKK